MRHKSKLNALKSCTTEVKSKPIYFTEPGIPLVIPTVPGAQRGLVYPRKCLPVVTVIITDTISTGNCATGTADSYSGNREAAVEHSNHKAYNFGTKSFPFENLL